MGFKLESSTPLLMSTLRIKIDVTGATNVQINGLGQHGNKFCGYNDFMPVRQIEYRTLRYRYRSFFNRLVPRQGYN